MCNYSRRFPPHIPANLFLHFAESRNTGASAADGSIGCNLLQINCITCQWSVGECIGMPSSFLLSSTVGEGLSIQTPSANIRKPLRGDFENEKILRRVRRMASVFEKANYSLSFTPPSKGISRTHLSLSYSHY